MHVLSRSALAVAFLALLVPRADAQTNPAHNAAITIPEMVCPGCVKKVSEKLQAVPGVGAVRAGLRAHVIVVTPRPLSAVSPRRLWEAVEAAGKRPTRLECPAGTFTAKPQS